MGTTGYDFSCQHRRVSKKEYLDLMACAGERETMIEDEARASFVVGAPRAFRHNVQLFLRFLSRAC